MPGKALAGKKEVLGKAYAANRQLVPRDSDVRMSDGIPEMFKSPSAARGLKRPVSSPTQLVSHQRPGSRLQTAMGYDLEKSRGKTAKQNAKPVFRRPACKKHAGLGKSCLGKGTEKKNHG